MHLLPSSHDISAWTQLVPQNGDLVFFENKTTADKFENLGVPILTAAEARAQCEDILGLNERSWYGYPLRRARYCAKLPPGLIESLKPELQGVLFQTQKQVHLPSILKIKESSLKKSFLSFGKNLWITSQAWRKAKNSQRHFLMRQYYEQNPLVEKYQAHDPRTLPKQAQETLQRLQLQKLVNVFPDHSGPNCFAGVAYGVSPHQVAGVADTWLYFGPLARFLKAQGYRKIRPKSYLAGDVLIFNIDRQKAHGLIYLGNGFIFEKPGQDFYEPYLVRPLAKAKASWGNAKIEVWRKI